MRFLLDSDVDAAVALVIRSARHECWTAAEAGLVGRVAATDEELSAYAIAHDALIVSHDRGPRGDSAVRVWLRAPQPDAADVVRHHLDALLAALGSGARAVTVSWETVGDGEA